MPSRVAAEVVGLAVRHAAIALLSILAAGCIAVAQQPAQPKTRAAVSPPPAKPNAADVGKCIGVVSAIGDTFSLQKMGITVFGNELNTVPIDGLGIVESGASFLTFDLIYALYWIRIYDGQTYEVIGKRGAITEQSNPLLSLVTTKSIGGPYLKVDRSWWPESDAAKSTMLKDGIRSLVEKSLDVTMPLILRVE